jgi:uncharacterized protein with FMN-binding domain
MENEPAGKNRQLVVTLAVLIVIVVIVGGVVIANKGKASDAADTTTASSSNTANDTPATTTGNESTTSDQTSSSGDSTSSSEYKDGSYTAVGSYSSPGGQESITISVTLKDGVITDTSAVSGATDSEGKEYQNQFIQAYKDMVVGKNISSVSLSRVSGSSLTSQGFNSAIQKIKTQAQA